MYLWIYASILNRKCQFCIVGKIEKFRKLLVKANRTSVLRIWILLGTSMEVVYFGNRNTSVFTTEDSWNISKKFQIYILE